MDAEEAVNVGTIVPGQDVSALKHDDASRDYTNIGSLQSLQDTRTMAVDSQEISLVVEMNTDPASPEKTSIKEDNPEEHVFYQHDMQDITVTCDTHPEVLHACKEELVSEGILDGTKEIGIDDSNLQLQEGAGKPHVGEDANPRMNVFQVGDVEAKQVHGPKWTQICTRELDSANLEVAFKVKGDTLPSEEDILHASSVGGCRLINDKATEGNVTLATQGYLDTDAKAIINGANKINSAEQVEDVGRDFTQIVVEKEEELRSRDPQPEALYVQKFPEHHGVQSREPVQDSCGNMEVEINASGNDFEKQQAMMGVEQSWRGHFEMPIRLGIEKPFADSYPQAEMMKGQEVLEMHSGTRGHRETSRPKGKVVKEEEPGSALGQHWRVGIVMQVKANTDTACSLGGIGREDKREAERVTVKEVVLEAGKGWVSQGSGYGVPVPEVSMAGRAPKTLGEEKRGVSDEANMVTLEKEKYMRFGLDKGGTSEKASQKRKLSGNLISDNGTVNDHGGQGDNVAKKSKKKAVNVWAKSSSRKGGKKNNKNGGQHNPANEDSVLITPTYVHPDKLDDGPDQPIALSKYDKAEKIELSETRLSASSTKGYRMVRATRGVQEGTWYFEIVVEQLGPTGHTRLGWSTQKGDVQAPVGFDTNSYGYRDVDGSKVHVAMREPYGDPYFEGDVIGFYIHLPNGSEYAPKAAQVISYRGRPYLPDVKDEHPQKVPGSEVCFFRNGICQGTAFKDINGGRYFPAASMYTLPKEPGCMVRFNFGPDFCFPPVDLDGRLPPKPMAEAPYHNGLHVSANGSTAQNVGSQMKIL